MSLRARHRSPDEADISLSASPALERDRALALPPYTDFLYVFTIFGE
jgi:hypothetical protein